jgi:hypothetical protein
MAELDTSVQVDDGTAKETTPLTGGESKAGSSGFPTLSDILVSQGVEIPPLVKDSHPPVRSALPAVASDQCLYGVRPQAERTKISLAGPLPNNGDGFLQRTILGLTPHADALPAADFDPTKKNKYGELTDVPVTLTWKNGIAGGFYEWPAFPVFSSGGEPQSGPGGVPRCVA